MHGGPEVQDIAVGSAILVETLIEVFAEVDGEGSLAVRGLAMDGTGASSLLALAAQAVEQGQLAEHLFHGDLLTEESEVDAGPGVVGNWSCRGGVGGVGDWVDRRRTGLYAGGSRG